MAAGKQVSLGGANQVHGTVSFPGGEGMAGVNVLVVREPTFSASPQGWVETSTISGSRFRRSGASPFVAPPMSPGASQGTPSANYQGYYLAPFVAIEDPHGYQTEIVSTEPLNPLYIGAASVGPYSQGIAAPPGSPPTPYVSFGDNAGANVAVNFAIADAPSACGNGTDGTPAAPMLLPAGGWWNGLICGYGHASYIAAPVKPGRSLTVEVTALDAEGFATTTKLMPVIALFAPTDLPGTLPSLAVAPAAFQALGLGTTNLSAAPFAANEPGGTVRIGIADQRGDGRPDYTYQARLFYADSLIPAQVPGAGGTTITITGSGFRAGNAVTINGVSAQVTSWSASTIVLSAPSMAVAGAVAGNPVDVEVTDLGTGATSTMTAALTYGGASQPASLRLVTAQAAAAFVGHPAATPFAVQVLAADGVTPVAGATVVFSNLGASASFGACGASACTFTTDAMGTASSTISPAAAGTVTMQAALGALTVSASFPALLPASALNVQRTPAANVTVGQNASSPFQVQLVDASNNGIAGRLITFSATQGSVVFAGCDTSPCSTTTNQYGQAGVLVNPSLPGAITLQATDGLLSAQISFSAAANPPVLTLPIVPSAKVYVNDTAGIFEAALSQGGTMQQYTPVALSAPVGVNFTQCSSNTCILDTDYFGTARTNVVITAPGTFTLTASYGAVSVSTQVTATLRSPTITILSAPSGNVPVGAFSPTPLTAQLLDGYGRPMVAFPIALGGPLDGVALGCGVPSCIIDTDQNGMASTTVAPAHAGLIQLSAVWDSLVADAYFTAVGSTIAFNLMTPPPPSVPVLSHVSFSLLATTNGAGGPLPNQTVWVTVTSGDFAIHGCDSGFCKLYTNQSGIVTISGTALTPGLDTIAVAMDGIIVTVSFQVLPADQAMKLISAPAGTYPPGAAVTPAFAVQVVAADGVTPVPGQNVTFSVPGGAASLAACPATPCVIKTNASGIASSGLVSPFGLGPVTLQATDNALVQSASFSVVPKPDKVQLLSTPTSVFMGSTAATPFAIAVTGADGTTPAIGVTVTLSLGSGTGAAWFSACGQPTCTLVTDAAGRVSSAVEGVQLGATVLVATVTLATGNQTLSSPLLVVANVETLLALQPPVFLAEGAIITFPLRVAAVANGSPAADLTVTWTGGTGFAVSPAASPTDASGHASAQSVVGPLAAGTQVSASACAWTSICAQFQAAAVPASAFAVTIVSGAAQAALGTPLSPVVAQVTDGSGTPVAGASVNIGQTAYALDVPCPAAGRCPASPVLASGSTMLITNLAGQVSITPLTVAGTSTSTALAFSAGTQGFATTIVTSKP
jgi:hypothetical protein